MQVPVRLVAVLRPQVHPAVLLAVGVSTVVFTASPFLIDDVADQYRLGLSVAALISTAQLAGFGLAAFGAGRWLAGRPGLFVISCLALVGFNLGSALIPPFAVLVALRFGAGAAMGVVSWMAWTMVFGEDSRTGEVSMVGPLVGIVAAPIIAPVATADGISGIYVLLALVAMLPLAIVAWRGQPAPPRAADQAFNHEAAAPVKRQRHRPVAVAMVILVCLALFSMGGSSVWMFTAVFGEERGLSVTTLAWAYSANAVTGTVGARWSGPRGPAGIWIAAVGCLALVVSTQANGAAQLLAMTFWGFCFWMGLPAAFRLLAARSAYPEERAGDAQAFLAAGRVLGPTVGGLTLEHAGAEALGFLAASIMIGAGLVLVVLSRPADARHSIEATA